jgi:hypothetical protein
MAWNNLAIVSYVLLRTSDYLIGIFKLFLRSDKVNLSFASSLSFVSLCQWYCVFCHSSYLVSDCLFDIFKRFNTFSNILRKKYCCLKTIQKTHKHINTLVYQDYKKMYKCMSFRLRMIYLKISQSKSHCRNILKKIDFRFSQLT